MASVFNAATSSFVSIPSGDLCKTDGTVVEIFIKETKLTIFSRVKDDPAFKLEYELVRRLVLGAEIIHLARKEFLWTRSTLVVRGSRG